MLPTKKAAREMPVPVFLPWRLVLRAVSVSHSQGVGPPEAFPRKPAWPCPSCS